MSIIDEARKAFQLFEEGRGALEAITSAVADGSAAVSSSDQRELNTMLEKERSESRTAHDTLQNAINTSRLGI